MSIEKGAAGKRSAPYTSNKISRLSLGTEGGFSYALIATMQIVTRKTSDKKHLKLLSAFLSHFEQIAVCACAQQVEQQCIAIDLIDE